MTYEIWKNTFVVQTLTIENLSRVARPARRGAWANYKINVSKIEIVRGLSFQIEALSTPHESVLLCSQVYQLKAQPTCVYVSQSSAYLFFCFS